MLQHTESNQSSSDDILDGFSDSDSDDQDKDADPAPNHAAIPSAPAAPAPRLRNRNPTAAGSRLLSPQRLKGKRIPIAMFLQSAFVEATKFNRTPNIPKD